MTTVAIVPARGQSKGIKGKNLRSLGRRPLIEYTIEAALGSRHVDRVVVSTDDERIRAVATRAGAEVPFVRPDHLSTDTAPSEAVIAHAVEEIERTGGTISVVVTLQPTSPFRTGADIDAAIELMRRSGADSAVSVARTRLPISVLGTVTSDGRYLALATVSDVRRQKSPEAVRLTGGIYVTFRSLIGEGRLIGDRPVAFELTGPAAMDIDSMRDLTAARRVVQRLGI